jgi:hypothetical protein
VVGAELSLPRDETSALPEVLSSILGVNDQQPSDDTQGTSRQSLGNVHDVLDDSNTSHEPSFEESAVADFSRRIEAWAEEAINTHRITETQSSSLDIDSEQCYGMIHGCEARLIYNMQDLRVQLARMSSVDKWAQFQVSFMSPTCFLALEDTTICGQLRDGLYQPLHRICDTFSVRLIAYTLIAECLRVMERAKRQHEATIKVEINVYGPSSVRTEVGRILSQDRLYLQHLICGRAGFAYKNPHMLRYQDIGSTNLPEEQGSPHLQLDDPKEIQRTIFEICNSETRDEDVRHDFQNVSSDMVLFPHQTQAVQFMIEREVGPIPDDRKLWHYNVEGNRTGFQHAVTGGWTTEAHSETGGGLLADDMGMGKTRTTLSLIAKRLPAAREWSQSEQDSPAGTESGEIRSKATLVVVPSLLIMNDCWIREIESGLNLSLQYFKYHGKRRKNHTQPFFDSDIILTTYHTLAAERKDKRAPMKSIKWFRVVLDEAHTIRRQATGLYAAVAELDACSRWCLTGTPIQNHLGDLGTLLAFLRVAPFDNISVFRKYIVVPFSPLSPFSQDLPAAKLKLSLLLRSICIRRRIERLHLPPLEEVECDVQLSEQERRLYQQTSDSMSYMVSHGSREKYSGTPFGRFHIQLQLRRLCNHGTFQKPWRTREDDMQTQKEDFLSSIGKDGEVRCSRCHEMVLILATNCAATRQLPSCSHVLCNDCLDQLSEEATHPLSASVCPDCPTNGSSSSLKAPVPKVGPFPNKPDFLPTGHSSKMEALMADVKDRLEITKR